MPLRRENGRQEDGVGRQLLLLLSTLLQLSNVFYHMRGLPQGKNQQ